MPKRAGGYRIPKPRGPAIFKLPLGKLFAKEQEKQEPPYPPEPESWTGSLAEWAVNWALETIGVEFVYQANFLGGRLTTGGTVVDFLIPDRMLIIRIQGEYWHYERGPLVVNADAFLKMTLEAHGYTVIDIDAEDALADPIYFVQEALAGRDHSRMAEGI